MAKQEEHKKQQQQRNIEPRQKFISLPLTETTHHQTPSIATTLDQAPPMAKQRSLKSPLEATAQFRITPKIPPPAINCNHLPSNAINSKNPGSNATNSKAWEA
jgi:hypothetical protein